MSFSMSVATGALGSSKARKSSAPSGSSMRMTSGSLARQRANATLASSHDVDRHEACALAVDLRPLILEAEASVEQWLDARLDQFRAQLLTPPHES